MDEGSQLTPGTAAGSFTGNIDSHGGKQDSRGGNGESRGGSLYSPMVNLCSLRGNTDSLGAKIDSHAGSEDSHGGNVESQSGNLEAPKTSLNAREADRNSRRTPIKSLEAMPIPVKADRAVSKTAHKCHRVTRNPHPANSGASRLDPWATGNGAPIAATSPHGPRLGGKAEWTFMPGSEAFVPGGRFALSATCLHANVALKR